MGKMHRPPLALAASRDTPSQLGPQGFERESLGEPVVGAAVDGADIVVVAPVHRKRRRNDFLTARRIIWRDRKSVVRGRRGSVRVARGGRLVSERKQIQDTNQTR